MPMFIKWVEGLLVVLRASHIALYVAMMILSLDVVLNNSQLILALKAAY